MDADQVIKNMLLGKEMINELQEVMEDTIKKFGVITEKYDEKGLETIYQKATCLMVVQAMARGFEQAVPDVAESVNAIRKAKENKDNFPGELIKEDTFNQN